MSERTLVSKLSNAVQSTAEIYSDLISTAILFSISTNSCSSQKSLTISLIYLFLQTVLLAVISTPGMIYLNLISRHFTKELN
jgi:hypothetical protein